MKVINKGNKEPDASVWKVGDIIESSGGFNNRKQTFDPAHYLVCAVGYNKYGLLHLEENRMMLNAAHTPFLSDNLKELTSLCRDKDDILVDAEVVINHG